MKKAKIETSARMGNSVAISWDDGLNLFFDAENVAKAPVVCRMGSEPTEKEVARRIVVSRTSAEVTLNGCAVCA